MKDTAKTAARIRRPTGNGDRPAARRAAEQKARNRDIASRLRRSGRIAALGADIADMAEQGVMLALSADEGYEHIGGELTAIGHAARDEAAIFADGPRNLTEAAGAVAELKMQHRESGRAVMRELRLHPGLFEEVQQAERSASIAQEAIATYRTTLKDADRLVKTLTGLSEKLDIAGINASLEAGKSQSDDVFLPLTEQARALSAEWSGAVERFAAAVAEQKRIAGDSAGKSGEILDRIRALGAMVKGVRTSFDDLGAERDAILTTIERLSGETDACTAAIRNCQTADTIWAGGSGMQTGLNTLFDADNRFCDAIDNLATHVEHVAGAAADYSEGSAKAAGLIDAAEQLLGMLPEVSALADPVADELASFERRLAACAEDLKTSGGGFDTLYTACETAEGTAASLTESYRALDTSMNTSLDVLRQAVREFGNLHEEQRGSEAMFETLKGGVSSLARFEGRFAVYASRLESLASTSGMEVRNAGEQAGGFKSIPAKFAETAAGLSGAAVETGRIADALSIGITEISRAVRNYGWRERMLYARSFAAALEDAVTTTREVTLDTCDRIAINLAGCRTAVRDARLTSSMDARLAAMADLIGSARESLGSRRKIIADMADATERLAGYAESVSVELE